MIAIIQLKKLYKRCRKFVSFKSERILSNLACLLACIPRRRNYLAVMAIFKNEAHVLGEWCQHYRSQGVDHILLINNGSTDNFLVEIQPYIDSGLVRLVNDDRKHAQRSIYNENLAYFRFNIEWLLVCDLDEFIYARSQYCRIRDYLLTVPWTTSAIYLPWKIFGSSDCVAQPSSVIRGFVHRAHNPLPFDADQPHRSHGLIEAKYLTRPQRTLHLDLHGCHLLFGKARLSDGSQANNPPFQLVSEKSLDKFSLHLNHYQVQSLDFFVNVKSTRGDADSKFQEQLRDRAYFDKWDLNDVVDTELADRSTSSSPTSHVAP